MCTAPHVEAASLVGASHERDAVRQLGIAEDRGVVNGEVGRLGHKLQCGMATVECSQ